MVYHPKKKVSANYIGAFAVDSIKNYLDDVLVGKNRLYVVFFFGFCSFLAVFLLSCVLQVS